MVEHESAPAANTLRTRRGFLRTAGAALGAAAVWPQLAKAQAPPALGETYDTQIGGIRILPGYWRPHYPWEHILWVSPAWPSQDYIWLDFPEALFTNRGLLYLSHINPQAPAAYPEWPPIPWKPVDGGLACTRNLPDGVAFTAQAVRGSDSSADLTLTLTNGSKEPLTNITLQTCAFLRAIKEFADYTADNKYVHVAGRGWMPYPEARHLEANGAPYRVGWRTRGTPLCDWPVMVTVSNRAERLVAMTWLTGTLSMVSNPNHPCMHADPQFPDLASGESATIRGKLIFFEGKLEDFDFPRLAGLG